MPSVHGHALSSVLHTNRFKTVCSGAFLGNRGKTNDLRAILWCPYLCTYRKANIGIVHKHMSSKLFKAVPLLTV